MKLDVGGGYRELAAHFDMSYDRVKIISQTSNPTRTLLNWIEVNSKNTIAKLRQVLVEMGRDDCVMIIDGTLSGMYNYYIVLLC